MLEEEVEGFIPAGQLGIEDLRDPTQYFDEGDALDVKITRVDPANHRILLSVKAWLAEQDEETRKAFQDRLSAQAERAKEAKGKTEEVAAGEASEATAEAGEAPAVAGEATAEAGEAGEATAEASTQGTGGEKSMETPKETPEESGAEGGEDEPPRSAAEEAPAAAGETQAEPDQRDRQEGGSGETDERDTKGD